jgi:hypothetical protein
LDVGTSMGRQYFWLGFCCRFAIPTEPGDG